MEDTQIFELHAEVCKALANPKRLQIINILQEKELTVGEIVKQTGAQKSNISQHLTMLRVLGILNSRKQGQKVFYKISDARIIEACMLMREVLMARLKKSSELATLTEQTK